MNTRMIPWLVGVVIGLTLTSAGGQTMPGPHMGMPGMGGNGMMGPQGQGVGVMPDGGAFGHRGDAAKVDRTIVVGMNDDMRFTPDRIDVKVGETVRLEIRNNGKIEHNMMFGPLDQLKLRAERMRQMWGNMPHAGMMALAPGQTTDLVWQFDRPGSVDYACLVPGHLEAGMVGKIVVGP